MFNQLGVIGCGLMGGSFALALKRAGLVKRVVGYSKSPSTTERAQEAGRHRRRRRIGAAGGGRLRHRADRRAGGGHRDHASRPSATWSSPACCSWTWAAPSATWSTPRGACCASASRSFVPAHPIAGKEVVGHPACRRRAVQRPPGDPDAAAADRARAGAEGHRRLVGHRRAGAEDDAREPRRRLRRREPPAAPAGLRLLQRRRQPAGRRATSCRWPARASATSRASPPATRRCGATSCWPTAKRCSSSRSASATRSTRWSTSCATATPTRWKT